MWIKAKLRPVRHWARAQINFLTIRINPRPVIVLGNPKSGTTAIAALLAVYGGLTSSTEGLPWLYGEHIEEFTNRRLGLKDIVANNRRDFACGLIKEPFLTQLYGDLRTRFPRSSYVFIVRDPRDNIRSILDRVKLPGNLDALTQAQSASIQPAWREVIENRFYGLQSHSYIESLAQRWSTINRIYLDHAQQLTLCRYETFLAGKEQEICRLANELKLPGRNNISEKLDIQFQRKGNRDVNWQEFYGTRNLETINRICAAEMSELGYSIRAVCPA
jgi:hypothetical protein